MVTFIPVEAAAEHTPGEAAAGPTAKSNACPPGGGELGGAEQQETSDACPLGGAAAWNVHDIARVNAPKKKDNYGRGVGRGSRDTTMATATATTATTTATTTANRTAATTLATTTAAAT